MNIASYIDHTILKQTTGKSDIEAVCREAQQYGFAAVCVPPIYVKQAKDLLSESDVKIATVIGFPFGYSFTSAKVNEATQALEEGAQELDMVMNIAALKNKNFDILEAEIDAIVKVARPRAIIKVIIESGILTNEEIVECCRFYQQFDINFLKTSTGYAEKGASVEAVQLMRLHLPSTISIKASGGIKTYDFAKQLVNAGASRLGCSASVAITKGENAGSGNY